MWSLFKHTPAPLKEQQPQLIQRCDIDDHSHQLKYQYMGSTEFELGAQARSLRRMFESEIELHNGSVQFDGKNVEVFLVAQKGSDFESYTEVVQGLINGDWYLQEPALLDTVLKNMFEPEENDRWFRGVDVWFDFTNDVLFTLSNSEAEHLTEILADIKKKWQQKDS